MGRTSEVLLVLDRIECQVLVAINKEGRYGNLKQVPNVPNFLIGQGPMGSNVNKHFFPKNLVSRTRVMSHFYWELWSTLS